MERRMIDEMLQALASHVERSQTASNSEVAERYAKAARYLSEVLVNYQTAMAMRK